MFKYMGGSNCTVFLINWTDPEWNIHGKGRGKTPVHEENGYAVIEFFLHNFIFNIILQWNILSGQKDVTAIWYRYEQYRNKKTTFSHLPW